MFNQERLNDLYEYAELITEKRLTWVFLKVGWCAQSLISDNGDAFKWIVTTGENGKFYISQSTPELIIGFENAFFDTYVEAINFCDMQELKSIGHELKDFLDSIAIND